MGSARPALCFVCNMPANRALMAETRTIEVLHRYLEWWPQSDVICVLREIFVDNQVANDMISEKHIRLYCRKLLDQATGLASQLREEQNEPVTVGQTNGDGGLEERSQSPELIPSMPTFGAPRSVLVSTPR